MTIDKKFIDIFTGLKRNFGYANIKDGYIDISDNKVINGEFFIDMKTIKVLDMISSTTTLRDQLEENTIYFRNKINIAGFEIKSGVHPIVPIMLGDAKLAKDIATDMLTEGIYVVGFSYPVVPKKEARIRVQISAAHTKEQLDKAIGAFLKVGKKYQVIS